MSAPFRAVGGGERFELSSPTALPYAAGFLWNRQMMIQVNCRGQAVAQFMQPEPAKYARGPMLEARTFMQPEQQTFTHHPGRFVYVKDEETGESFSAPFEPARRPLSRFLFSIGKGDLRWEIECDGLRVDMGLSLPLDEVVELWTISISNVSERPRQVSVYPYFPVGYASWMNQGGSYRSDLGGVVCRSVTPYQNVSDYFRNRLFKDCTYLLADSLPDSWEANQAEFEGWGGLASPEGLKGDLLARGEAAFEIPACILQYRHTLAVGERATVRLLFGPARDDEEIAGVRKRFFGGTNGVWSAARASYEDYVRASEGFLTIDTPDETLNQYVNHWLPRQMLYHGDTNRLTTDPQTRNYLQDAMGMAYLRPATARAAFSTALGQQKASGAMPDGVLLVPGAELKYINQVPHTDHNVWLPVCMSAYLDETDDYSLLDAAIPFADDAAPVSVFEHVTRAMTWLYHDRDGRGLSYIRQGDWCDPMNMAGYRGKGVSGWLTLAAAYAMTLWGRIARDAGRSEVANEMDAAARELNDAVNNLLWDGDWYARGITDDGVVFGRAADAEGRVFLNPQSWALLSGAARGERQSRLVEAVETHLETPYGVMKLAPPYSRMREDVGRVTQKFPGSAENGSIYNHAAAFWAFALYAVGDADRAYRTLRHMLPGPDESDLRRRGQLPVFIPNYYRGAYREHPRTAGRSSQLFNTGTVAWYYRCLVEGLFGLRGSRAGLIIDPHLPSGFSRAQVTRRFRGATLLCEYRREPGLLAPQVLVDGCQLGGNLLTNIESGRTYQIRISLPA